MNKATVLLLFLFISAVQADLPIEKSDVIAPHGYHEFSFQIVADFTMDITGLVDSNTTLYIMSNSSFISFENQEPFSSYLKRTLSNDFEIRFETGNYLEEYLFIVLVNYGDLPILFDIQINYIRDTTESDTSFKWLGYVVLSFVVISNFKRRSNKRNLIGKL